MDPVVPVLATASAILKESGVFAAIIDGDAETAPGYLEIHDIIYAHAQRKYPDYGVIELGDPRVRTAEGLQKLMAKAFVDSDINITPCNLSLNAAPEILAREAAGFFYASFVLSVRNTAKCFMNLKTIFCHTWKMVRAAFLCP